MAFNTDETKNHLFSGWWNDVSRKFPQPVHQDQSAREILTTARQEARPVALLMVGCLNWRQAEYDPENNWITALDSQNKRLQATRDRIASLVSGLHSFGIPTQQFLSLSRLEAETLTLGTLGKSVVNTPEEIRAVQEKSIDTAHQLFAERGVAVTFIDDTQVFMREHHADSISTLQERLIGDGDGISGFYTGMYESLVRHLPPEALSKTMEQTDQTPAGIIWLDLMSPLAGPHRAELLDMGTRYRPEMPIITPSANSGKWWTPRTREAMFPDKLDFIGRRLGISTYPGASIGEEDLIRIIPKLGRTKLARFFDVPRDQINRGDAIDRIFEISGVRNSAQEATPDDAPYTAEPGDNILGVYKEVTGKSTNHTIKDLRRGIWAEIPVDGNPERKLIKDGRIPVQPGMRLNTGRNQWTLINFPE